MLLIVVAALIAYFGLGALEKAKSTYEGEQSAPLVIVERDEANDDQKKNASGDNGKKVVTELPASQVKAQLPASMQHYIDKIEHQNFKSANELIDRLNEEVLATGDANKKEYQDKIDNLNKSSITEFSTFLSSIRDTQKNHVDAETIKGLIDAIEQNQAGEKGGALAVLRKQSQAIWDRYKAFQTAYGAAKEDLQLKMSGVDKIAHNELKTVYSDFKPKLQTLIQDAKGKPQNESPFWNTYNPSSVLNEKNGSHVIYQTIWLTFVIVLVFGVLYVILMLLRPLPPFAGGTEALTEQAKTFLSRRGGGGGGASTPELARTIAVTAAALGIGAAVVVAGGAAGRKAAPAANVDYSDSEAQGDVSRPNNRYLNAGNRSGNELPRFPEIPAAIINLPPVDPPPVYYFPTNKVDVPKIDETRLNQLSAAINNLTDPRTGVEARLRDESTKLGGQITAVDKKFGTVDVPALKVLVDPLPGKVQGLETTAGQLRSEFLDKLNSASATVEDIRGDSLERFRRPEGRNLFTRFKQLFDKERYVVSGQSHMALKNLMSYRVSQPCLNDPKKTCVETKYRDPNAQKILETLETLIGEKPMDESTFLGKFTKDNIKPWKTLILRYTRVPY